MNKRADRRQATGRTAALAPLAVQTTRLHIGRLRDARHHWATGDTPHVLLRAPLLLLNGCAVVLAAVLACLSCLGHGSAVTTLLLTIYVDAGLQVIAVALYWKYYVLSGPARFQDPLPWLARPSGVCDAGVQFRWRVRRLVQWAAIERLVDHGGSWRVFHRGGAFALDKRVAHHRELEGVIRSVLAIRRRDPLASPEPSADSTPRTALSFAHDNAACRARTLSPADPPDQQTESEDA